MTYQANDRKVLLIGWDAADWRVIRPMMEEGKMPNLKRYLENGCSGNIATLRPILSPMLWTSIATGKRPFKHGIHGFTEPTPDGKAIRPITNLSRKTKALWNVMTQVGKKSIVVGWWPSSPAEPIDGVMVSNHYQRAVGPLKKAWPMAPGTVHPPRLVEELKEFRFHPGELRGEHIAPFVPNFMKIDQKKDKRLTSMAKIISDATSIHGAATALMQLEPWDLMAVYYDAIDHFGHGFMKYHPPRQEWVSEEDFEHYKGVIEAGYRFHDTMLGVLIKLAGEDATVVLMSDHGFHPDHLRPKSIPAEPAGPAIEHREFGILAVSGPGIKKGETIHGASVLDVAPTILTLFGLPVGADIDGKPLLTIFEDPPEVEIIDSWDSVEGECGMHPEDARMDATENAEAIKQLVALGYIEEPDEDQDKAIRECVRELRYNLAQSYIDANRYVEATLILEELWSEWPDEHRFGTLVIECYGALGELEKRREAVDLFEANARKYRAEAIEELKKLKPEVEKYRQPAPDEEPEAPIVDELGDLEGLEEDAAAEAGDEKAAPPAEAKAAEPEEMPRKLQFQLRKLTALAAPRDAQVRWLRATQALAEGDSETCLKLLDPLSQLERENPSFHLQLGHAFLRLDKAERAIEAFEKALVFDPENARAFHGLAEANSKLENWENAIDAALSTTELLYFNPRAHVLLATGLMRTGDIENAEKAYGVALAQAPNYGPAHIGMAELCEEHLDDVPRARKHRKSVREARQEIDWDKAMQRLAYADSESREKPTFDIEEMTRPWDDVNPDEVITVVSGLPRSGTSMMMQMLTAGGLAPFTDEDRTADESNPKGYYEHNKVMQLQRDASWVPEARGKVVKVIAQLIPFLPKDQRYEIVFMKRDLAEIVASQRAMLERLDRKGAAIDDATLMSTLARQVDGVLRWIATSGCARLKQIDYAEAVADPTAAAASANEFLGDRLDAAKMTGMVDASLRRQRAEG